MRKGIYAAGNFIIDEIKVIDEFPREESLANILEIKTNNGGAPYNLLKDLSYLHAPFPLYAAGLVGNDEKGHFIIEDLQSCGVNTESMQHSSEAPTSFTDVVTVASTGKRTFFHNRGANALFGPEHISYENQAKIFFLAYLLLLDRMDETDEYGRSAASYVFENAQNAGFITATDMVSVSGDGFRKSVPSALPYINYLFVNEYEASQLTGIQIDNKGTIDRQRAEKAVRAIIDMGVQDYVILHFPQGALACDARKHITFQPSLNIPSGLIRGAAGAGDAFAAGVLWGLHENMSVSHSLQAGMCAAAASLFDESCSDGLKNVKDPIALADEYGFRS